MSSSNRKKINNYRWRLGLAKGESKYDEIEKRLAAAPVLTVPTITLEGDANGAPHPDASTYAKKFSGRYAHRVINGGVGHNLPQEGPREFAKAENLNVCSPSVPKGHWHGVPAKGERLNAQLPLMLSG